MATADYWITVIDTIRPGKPFPSAEKLVENGKVPVKVAARWKRVRREMTSGLKRRVKESVN